MDLSTLVKITDKKGKRLGRGRGSGKGDHTVGKGVKGQKSRGGGKVKLGFEGGQTPLYKRLPQIGGFRNPTTKQIVSVPLYRLNSFRANSTVTPEALVDEKIIKAIPKNGVKILGNGKIEKKLTLSGFTYTKSAKEKIEKSGSKIL